MSSEAGQAVVDSSGLSLQVQITDVGACRKRISVTVSEADIREIRLEALEDLGEKAQVPGFRVGRVPIGLLEKRFKSEIASDIKQKVLVASLEQLSAEFKIEPISEPSLDVASLDIPDSGDFHYEFEVEVRPQFDLPEYSGITIQRAEGEPSEEEIQVFREELLQSRADVEATVESASPGDAVVCDLRFSHGDRLLREVRGQNLRLLPQLNFQDALLAGFDQLMTGVREGDVRTAEVVISLQSPVVEMRGEKVSVEFQVKEVQHLRLPVIDNEFCERFGASGEAEFNELIRSSVIRQHEFEQRQSARRQLLEKITASAEWDLPETLVRQQVENALRREVLEMSQAGFTPEQIQARESQIRQNALETTRQALREHFILDRVASVEEIDCTESDIDRELQYMSMQSGEPLRRIRARMAKSGMIENLRAQLRERKTVDFLLSKVTVETVPRVPVVRPNEASVRFAICGDMPTALIDDTASAEESE